MVAAVVIGLLMIFLRRWASAVWAERLMVVLAAAILVLLALARPS